MAMQRNKGVLEGNIFHANNQTLTIQGIPSPVKLIQRDAITVEQEVIELPDKRQVPSGRNNFGDFNAQIQLADDATREAILAWEDLCKDRGNGISPSYKRDGILTYVRLFQGSPGTEFAGAGSAGDPFKVRIIGMWIKSVEYPEFTMEGQDHSVLTVGFCYDDVEPERKRNIASQIGGLFGAR